MKPTILGGPGSIEDSAAVLARALFRGDVEEVQVRALHPQALHLAIKVLGLESANEVLSIVSKHQYTALLDFEFWTRDSFREERFWNWIKIIDDDKDLLPIQKFLQSVDPTILNLIFNRYIEVVYHEEATDSPPNENAYTPDGGLSWITLKTHDADKHRILGRLLAFLYQVNREAFYQYLAFSNSGTSMEFEEEAFQEKNARLSLLSVPNIDEASKRNKPLSEMEALKKMIPIFESFDIGSIVSDDVSGSYLLPLYGTGIRFQPLFSSIERLDSDDLYRIQLEIGVICNNALVFFTGDFGEDSSLKILSEQVFGAINIGLEAIAKLDNRILNNNVIGSVALTDLYRVGLSKLFEVRTMSQKVPEDILSSLSLMNQPLHILVEKLAKVFPVVPSFLREDGTFDIDMETLDTQEAVIYSLDQLTSIKQIIQSQVLDKFLEIRSYQKQHTKHALVGQNVSKDVQ